MSILSKLIAAAPEIEKVAEEVIPALVKFYRSGGRLSEKERKRLMSKRAEQRLIRAALVVDPDKV